MSTPSPQLSKSAAESVDRTSDVNRGMFETQREGMPSTDFPVPSVSSQNMTWGDDDSVRTLATRSSRASAWVPRPSLVVRLVLGMIVVLLGVLALLGGIMAQAVGDVVVGIRDQIEAEPVETAEEPLPSEQVLLDEQSYGAAVQARPERRAQLALARAEALNDNGDKMAALEIVQGLQKEFILSSLSPEKQLRIAHLLVAAERPKQAYEFIRQRPLETWPDSERRQAAALIGRLVAHRYAVPNRL